ncbi:uncharacterized protein LOC135120593 [Zophobas morio]|uniref:uncharacterized protein LOC135120593 n=1 Tax=Zophobas morio TaxID=2755281 RepID=UPI0030836259
MSSASSNIKWLKKKGITHILVTGAMLPCNFPEDFRYKVIFCLDTPVQNLLVKFEDAHAFIDEGRASGGVLVHCRYGRSRSVSFVISYLMRIFKMPFNEAFNTVAKARPDISPNYGFEEQLRLYETMKCRIDETHPSYMLVMKNTMP